MEIFLALTDGGEMRDRAQEAQGPEEQNAFLHCLRC